MSDPIPPAAQPTAASTDGASMESILGRDQLDALSLLQVFDLFRDPLRRRQLASSDLEYLRERIVQFEEQQDQARRSLEELDQLADALRSPALRMATCLGSPDNGTVWICLGGADYLTRLDPGLSLDLIEVGARVLCNEAFVVVRVLGFDLSGPVVRVEACLPDGRLRVSHAGQGSSSGVVLRSAGLAKEKLRVGAEVRLDPQQRVALEVLSGERSIGSGDESLPSVRWEEIGGQDEAVRAIRDSIELPYLHKDLFVRFRHSVPKGFLLHGPPGCGKTLLGKATAHNLRRQIRETTGVDRPEFFLHLKGPEVLNMWLGESERQVREVFARCRQRAGEGQLAFLFIDEAESLLGLRRSGPIGGITSTLVPMFCSEMDGIEPLSNVVVLLASNRPDLIDPAILRPGRIDRRIRVRRPDSTAARTIYRIHLGGGIPLAEPVEVLAEAAAAAHFAKETSTEMLEVQFRSGRREVLHHGDLASGSVIAAVVARAKQRAIRRAIETGTEGELTRGDLLEALREEHEGGPLFPASGQAEDWMKLTDLDPENVVQLLPVRRRSERTRVV